MAAVAAAAVVASATDTLLTLLPESAIHGNWTQSHRFISPQPERTRKRENENEREQERERTRKREREREGGERGERVAYQLFEEMV